MKGIFTLIFSIVALGTWAQVNGPESVDYDPSTQLYYISNKGNGRILVGPEGGPYTQFTANVSSPHGIEVVGNSVYVCDGSAIKEFEVGTGNLLETINISGASFLNGLTSDRQNTLWATDFSTGKVHEIDISTGIVTTIVPNTGTTPNGIIFDEMNYRLVIVNWGSNAPILAVDLSDNSLSTPVANSGLSNCDGVAVDCDGGFFISSWGAGALHSYNNDLSVGPALFVGGLSQPSDIYFNFETNKVVSANFGSDDISFHYVDCFGIGIAENAVQELALYPNPGNGLLEVDASLVGHSFQVLDLGGRTMLSGELEGTQLDLQELPNGSYLLLFRNDESLKRGRYTKR